MRWLQAVTAAWECHCREHQRHLCRLRDLYRESERLRAELSHLERELNGIHDSSLPRCQKGLLESAIRVRLRRVEDEMLRRQGEIAASGHLVPVW